MDNDEDIDGKLREFQEKGEAIAAFFRFAHLPPVLKDVSRPFAVQALDILSHIRPSAERSAGLRKLLEAKDCIVRAAL